MNDYQVHPAARIFPDMDADEFAALKADIAANGQRDPAVLYKGQILDGRHRRAACDELGIAVNTVNWEGDDPVAYVISVNLHRRHLTPGQRAMCAARAREMYDLRAKERQRLSEGRGKKGMANLPDLKGTARDDAGKVFGVSGRSVDYAAKVIKDAVPEVVKAVDDGRMAVSTAAILSSEPEEKQRQAVKDQANRNYKSTSKPPDAAGQEEEEPKNAEIERKGVGIFRANEAIDCLKRIPKNDALRKRGFQVVTDWIRHNK
jgi:ParB-like chromosome segregation protein Spo0J